MGKRFVYSLCGTCIICWSLPNFVLGDIISQLFHSLEICNSLISSFTAWHFSAKCNISWNTACSCDYSFYDSSKTTPTILSTTGICGVSINRSTSDKIRKTWSPDKSLGFFDWIVATIRYPGLAIFVNSYVLEYRLLESPGGADAVIYLRFLLYNLILLLILSFSGKRTYHY